MKNLNEISQKAEKLKRKKSWVKEEFQELMKNLNQALEFDKEVEFFHDIKELSNSKYPHVPVKLGIGVYKRKISIIKRDYYPEGYTTEKLSNRRIDAKDIRIIMDNFEEFTNELIKFLEKENNKYNETQNKINKLQDVEF